MHLKEEFNNYLKAVQLLSDDSIKSYLSLEKHLPKFFGNINFKKVVEEYDLDTILYLELPPFNEKEMEISKGTFENINTYLNRYKEFLIYQIEQNLAELETLIEENDEEISDKNEEVIALEVPSSVSNVGDRVYEKKEIEQNFYFRLITQNRFNSSGLYFPISFLKQYFYKTGDKKYFDEQIFNQIDEINVFVSEEKAPVKLKTLKKMEIKNGIAYFNGTPILTRNFKTNEFKKMEVAELRNIAIDHTNAISNILKENAENEKDFPQLLLISRTLKKYLKKPVTYKKLIAKGTKLSNDKNFINEIDKEHLKKEFEFLIKSTELQLMCSKENNRKRDN